MQSRYIEISGMPDFRSLFRVDSPFRNMKTERETKGIARRKAGFTWIIRAPAGIARSIPVAYERFVRDRETQNVRKRKTERMSEVMNWQYRKAGA